MFGLAANEPSLSSEQRRWRRDRRSAWLRVLAFLVLVLNLEAQAGNVFVHAHIVGWYGVATVLALMLALGRRGPPWAAAAFVIVDALLVVALFHEHLFAADATFDESLTAPSLAVGFLLLTHTALRLQAWLVLLFAAIVLGGWMSLLAITIAFQAVAGRIPDLVWSLVGVETALAAAFGFAAFICYLVVNDHDVLLKGAVTSEKRRRNLERFFSPRILTELQSKTAALDLSCRPAVVMFVDLRSFTRLSETVTLEELASLLSEYRQLVTDIVFAHGGTVDKFIGDGVMAVFGQPQSAADDAARGLQCALATASALAGWKARRIREGKPAVDAGIGLHIGPVVGGVLECGAHDEFTVFGDVVNVAERLEKLCKRFDAAVVASEDLFVQAPEFRAKASWAWKDAAELDGRHATLRVGFLARADLPLANVDAQRPDGTHRPNRAGARR